MDMTPISNQLEVEITAAAVPDKKAASAIRARIDNILRPPGALARLDELAVWIAEWHGTVQPAVSDPHALIFAADHGVVAEGVSAFPAEVTSAMVAAFNAKKASVSVMANHAGATVTVYDVGVGSPTGNLRVEPALTADRFASSFDVGRDAVRACSGDLLIFGEMGIGNTTAAAAVMAALAARNTPLDSSASVVGRGTGIDDPTLAHKQQVVADAVERISGVDDPLEILGQVGGAELVAIAGAMVQARIQGTPVLLDGYIATCPAVVLHSIDPRWTTTMRAGHCSAEPGHRHALDLLGLEPLLSLDFRLGEASGAMAALPLVAMACRLVTDVPTFDEWFGDHGSE